MKKLQLLFLAALAFANANAQKLPNKQEVSVRIPANVKIDGKATEWKNKFQAYNKSTDFFYTIANNNDELYLVIQTKDHFVINKIIDRGLTLSIKNPETGKAANFTFPAPVYNTINGRVSTTVRDDKLIGSPKLTTADIIANNKTLKEKHRFIKVEGVAGVDTLVSIYNENGIRAEELLDTSRVYTLEMAVKLKLMGVSSNSNTKIGYKLKVNGFDGPGFTPDNAVFENDARPTPEQLQRLNAEIAVRYAKTFGGTEFEGEYMLAK